MALVGALASAGLAVMPASGVAQTGDPCPNAEFRVGPGAKLPDCRAYELVSVPDSGGHAPVASSAPDSIYHGFEMNPMVPSGDVAMYHSPQGALPGFDGAGLSDRYLATRSEDGWATELVGPTGVQIETPLPGGATTDQQAFFVQARAVNGFTRGTLVDPYGEPTTMIRLPDGSFDVVGKGSLGVDPSSTAHFISDDLEHVIFDTWDPTGNGAVTPEVQLEPEAPGDGQTYALYDRPAFGGETKVVSLLPGDVTPAATQHALFQGASDDGDVVAFKLGAAETGPLYVRVDNTVTYEVTAGGNTFAGVYGGAVFYSNADSLDIRNVGQEPADLLAFDVTSQTAIPIATTDDARFVNISDDGSSVYFVSPSQIGGEGSVGEQNLYRWERDGNATTFVATLAEDDVTGDLQPDLFGLQNMSTWGVTKLRTPGDEHGRASAHNRASSDGSIFVFESEAQLTSFDNGSLVQVYRYDAESDQIDCVSCAGPEPATSEARLQSGRLGSYDVTHPLAEITPARNVTEDGSVVVFESEGSLVARDSNGRTDVYRWSPDSGIDLISSGQATQGSYLYDVSPDGADIMFVTPQSLVPISENGSTPALYDARVNGGITAQHETDSGSSDCSGEDCQESSSAPPIGAEPGSDAEFSGNPDRWQADCSVLARKAKARQAKAKKTRKQAKRASGKKAKKLRRKASKQKKKAKKLGRQAEQCRGASR